MFLLVSVPKRPTVFLNDHSKTMALAIYNGIKIKYCSSERALQSSLFPLTSSGKQKSQNFYANTHALHES